MARRFDIDRHGVEVVRGLVVDESLADLIETCPEGGAGLRSPLTSWACGCAAARASRSYLRDRWGRDPVLTRAILFDKRPDANWHLQLHQDLTIAVAERFELPGFGPWSIKDGRHHVKPPTGVLASMVTVRLHIDPADEHNGCLRVVPGSHTSGQTGSARHDASPSSGEPVVAAAGDAVLMRPLVLHGSERSSSNARRRVLHMEFAFAELPSPLAWAPVDIEGRDATP